MTSTNSPPPDPLAARSSRGIKGRLAKGSLWIGGARIAVNLMGFATTLVLARLLTPADFGLVALATTFVAIISAVTDLQLSSALVQQSDPTDDHFASAFTVALVRGTLLASALALSASLLAHLFKEPRLEAVLYALAASTVLSGLSNPRSIMLTRRLIFWQQFMLQVSQKVVALIISIAVAVVFRSYWALVAGLLAGQLCGVLVSYTVLPYRPQFSVRYVRELWGFSIWLTLGTIINTINWRFDQLLIGGWLGRTALGFYSVGDQIAITPTREAVAPLTPTLFPGFVAVSTEPKRLARAYQAAQALVTTIALPAGVGMALIARPFIEVTMGQKWLPAAAIVEVLASVFALQTLGSLVRPLAMACGQTRLLFRRDLQSFLIRLPTVFLGMYLAGMQGIIIARSLTGVIQIVLNLMVVRTLTGLSLKAQLMVNWRSVTSIFGMATAVLAAQALIGERLADTPLVLLCISIATGIIVYPASIAILWLASGRPAGPERDGLDLASKVLRRAFPGSRTTAPSA